MAKAYKFTPADVPPLHHGKSLYADIVTDFVAQGTESMQVNIEGMKPATLRAGLRRPVDDSGRPPHAEPQFVLARYERQCSQDAGMSTTLGASDILSSNEGGRWRFSRMKTVPTRASAAITAEIRRTRS
jgi:hypothetical protein